MPRIVDLPFSEGCQAIKRWGEALRTASLSGQPLPAIDEERFYIPLEAREQGISSPLPEMSPAS